MKRIFEYKNFNNLSNKELLEMSNITYKTTGIKNVVLWIGPNPEYHGKRIKVSNIPNKFDGKDCFTLTIPDFKIIGKVDITQQKLKQIKEFVLLNLEVINDYSDYNMSTEDLIEQLIRI